MPRLVLPLVYGVSAFLWLILLLATGFNALAVGAGLIAMLVVTGDRA